MDHKLDGGFDGGAYLVDGTVRRVSGAWTPAVDALLEHVRDRGFTGAPRPLGVDAEGRQVVSHLDGLTVGNRRPWPAWTHSDQALSEVAAWLRNYHEAVSDFVPPVDACWREGLTWSRGMIIGHNDAAPYNAVWGERGLVGFVDWDMAGPLTIEEDLAWVAFSWVPLHARALVLDEGFTAFSERRTRLELFLSAYGWSGTTDELLDVVRLRIEAQLGAVRAVAAAGDETYRRMLASGVDRHLEAALEELDEI